MLPDVDPEITLLYRVFDLIGVFLNGVIGGTVARKRGHDIIGFFILALLTALGGGMVRDMLIQVGTAAALADPLYLILAFSGAFVAFLARLEGRAWDIFRTYGDACVLGFWAVTGATKALAYNLPWIAAIFLGVLTAVGGGMLRDVVTNRTPVIFGGTTLYAIPAILSAVAMVVFHHFRLNTWGMLLAPLPGIILTLVADRKGWMLPDSKDWAPLNLSASQLRNAVRYADQYGFRAAWKRAEERQFRLGLPPKEREQRVAETEALRSVAEHYGVTEEEMAQLEQEGKQARDIALSQVSDVERKNIEEILDGYPAEARSDGYDAEGSREDLANESRGGWHGGRHGSD